MAAGQSAFRFALNSTLGFFGLFDPASAIGVPQHAEDFGQTLGTWGVGEGAYLVLPLLPPTTVRDGLGRVADSFMNPLSYFTPYYVPLSITVADTVNSRALNMKTYDALKLSIDPYGAVRNAYLQVRQRKLEAARSGGL